MLMAGPKSLSWNLRFRVETTFTIKNNVHTFRGSSNAYTFQVIVGWQYHVYTPLFQLQRVSSRISLLSHNVIYMMMYNAYKRTRSYICIHVSVIAFSSRLEIHRPNLFNKLTILLDPVRLMATTTNEIMCLGFLWCCKANLVIITIVISRHPWSIHDHTMIALQ